MAATLAAGGKNPVTGKQVMDAAKVPGVLAVMATAGLYDDSGKWLYQHRPAGEERRRRRPHRRLARQVRHRRRLAAARRRRQQRARRSGRSPTSRTRSAATRTRPRKNRRRADAGTRAAARHHARLSCAVGVTARARRSCVSRRHGCARSAKTDVVTLPTAIASPARWSTARSRPSRVQDRRCRHAVPGMGQAGQPRRDAAGRGADDRRQRYLGPLAAPPTVDQRRKPTTGR